MSKSIKIFLIFLCLIFVPVFSYASTTSGTIDPASAGYKYAWSNDSSWINFAPTNGSSYVGLTITDSGISGYAWSQNYGWINFAPKGGGVSVDENGVLSGSAWGENIGWIDFSGVTISSGKFTGQATEEDMPQINGNSPQINFDSSSGCTNCNVQTDYVPLSLRVSTSPNSGGGGGGAVPIKNLNPPPGGFGVSINNGAVQTNSAGVVIYLDGGPDAVQVQISNTPNINNATIQAYAMAKTWALPDGDGAKTVYVKFYGKNGEQSPVLSASINLDTQAPNIAINQIKQSYSSGEDIVIGGITNKSSQLFFSWDQQNGMTTAGAGAWSVNLGKMNPGTHAVEIIAEDSAGNSKTSSVQIVVNQPNQNNQSATQNITQKIGSIISNLIPKPQPVPAKQLITVPKAAPVAMSGTWNMVSPSVAQNFVFTPLPQDIQDLSAKFPQLAKTFSDVGIAKLTDLSKLQNTQLTVPSLSESVQPLAEVVPGKLLAAPALPVESLSVAQKGQIPSDTIFAKTGNGLIDINSQLSLDNQGNPQQKINTLAGSQMQLIVRPSSPAKSVTSYVVFNGGTLSLAPKNSDFAAALSNTLFGTSQAQTPDQKLVLSQVDYTNTGSNVFAGTVQIPKAAGNYNIVTNITYNDVKVAQKEIDLLGVVDPEGYIYQTSGGLQARISGAIVSLYWLNPNTSKYELWPAGSFQQQNPQVTDASGMYSFLVPDGFYYLQVSAPGYLGYQGKPFQISAGSGINPNIELSTQYWWMQFFDWRNILLAVVILLLVYNFYRDKIRDAISKDRKERKNILAEQS